MPHPHVAAVLSAALALAGLPGRSADPPPVQPAASPADATERDEEDDPAAAALAAVPPLSGEVVFAEGSFGGFVPPRAKQPFRLDFSRLPAVEDQGSTMLPVGPEGEKMPYVILTGPLRLERVYRTHGTVQGFRLASESRDRRLLIDVALYGGPEGTTLANAWLIEERGPIRSAAFVKGELAAGLPDGWAEGLGEDERDSADASR